MAEELSEPTEIRCVLIPLNTAPALDLGLGFSIFELNELAKDEPAAPRR